MNNPEYPERLKRCPATGQQQQCECCRWNYCWLREHHPKLPDRRLKRLSPPSLGPPQWTTLRPNDRIGALVDRIKADPQFISEQRRWLGAGRLERVRKYVAVRRANDPDFKLRMNLRGRIRAALKGAGKNRHTMQLIGCSIAELKAHLESLFMPGMSWSNYGEWHIDHIIPCRAFDLRCADDQRRCFHFTNLQPLWADDNFKKGGEHPVLRALGSDLYV